MRESKILKAICYIMLPILILLLILSMICISIKEDPYYSEEKYFSSEEFVSTYMLIISESISDLIYNNSSFESQQDNGIEIFYTTYQRYYDFATQEPDYLIIYKNKALTNVDLGTNTKTIEGIKEYIAQKENSKPVNIINGEISTESEIIKEKWIKYLDGEVKYYTIQKGENGNSNYYKYITTATEDFQIFTSYIPEFYENSQAEIMKNIINKMPLIEKYEYIIIPISTISIILIIVYLIIAIGYKKGKVGIDLNDIDKIPLEIIICIAIAIGCIPVVVLLDINEDYNAIFSLLITAYLSIYILSAITLHTLIKRIKSKTLLKTTIIGKMIILTAKILQKIINKTKSICNTFTYSWNMTLKLIMYIAIIGILTILIPIIFQDSAFMVIVLEFTLAGFVIYKAIKTVKNFSQIENKLKEMYGGNNQGNLEEEEFTNEFKDSVKYINDISNGFENAIQDRIKSERLKAELITNVSHDIKTPLTSIINYVDLLKQENIENEKAKEYIGILDNKSQRLKKLTEDLVEASKISTGNISLNLEKINIVELIRQAIGEFEDKFEKRGLQTIVDTSESEINIMADSRHMYRVIENLFSNIAKYALENSRVYIDLKRVQENAIIEIKNISKERLNISAEELMQRFVRGDKSRTTEGSGLGISIAQNLTELQNGKFNLKLDGDLFKVELNFWGRFLEVSKREK